MAKDAKKQKVKRPTAQKRALQSEKRRLINRAGRHSVNTGLRSFEETLKKGNAEEIKQKLNFVYSLLDKASKKGIFKQNKADRSKARLAARAAKVSA